MYTSGTTGNPKGVLISNESIITLLAGVKCLLESVNEEVTFFISIYRSHFLRTELVSLFEDADFLQNFLFLCVIYKVGWERRVSFLSSSCTYIWSGYWGVIYLDWCLNRVLAWGEYKCTTTSFSSITKYILKSDNFLFHILQDVKLLIEDIGELKPTIFCAVPRVLDRIYSGTIRIWKHLRSWLMF